MNDKKAKQPTRERGRQRVDQLLSAATKMFALHGYTGATMTEIARQAEAPIGSLYQFFPRKELLAQALIERYQSHIDESLRAIEQYAAEMTANQLAHELLQVLLSLDNERRCITALIAAQDSPAPLRTALRHTLRHGIRQVLTQRIPTLTAQRPESLAAVTANMMKATVWLQQEQSPKAAHQVWEEMLTLYLEQQFR